MVFAAIDIGSNAIRLLFCRVYMVDGKPHFNKEELIRMPIRLGEDVFLQGKIPEPKIERLVSAMRGFSELIKAYGVEAYKAVATSAMRDAVNGAEIIERIKKELKSCSIPNMRICTLMWAAEAPNSPCILTTK
ncbi:MAG: hypothetical protein MUF75_08230 [Bacteroidia bacterium]|nr:hypothetical protein [Bacteroidia bacterium]